MVARVSNVDIWSLQNGVHMKYIIFFLIFSSCCAKASNEMEEMTRDVLKSKSGVDIEVRPIPRQSIPGK